MSNDRLHARETLEKAVRDVDLRNDAAAIERCADAAELLADLHTVDDADTDDLDEGPVRSAIERIGRVA